MQCVSGNFLFRPAGGVRLGLQPCAGLGRDLEAFQIVEVCSHNSVLAGAFRFLRLPIECESRHVSEFSVVEKVCRCRLVDLKLNAGNTVEIRLNLSSSSTRDMPYCTAEIHGGNSGGTHKNGITQHVHERKRQGEGRIE